MANKGLISDKLREEIAKELGVYEQVKQYGNKLQIRFVYSTNGEKSSQ